MTLQQLRYAVKVAEHGSLSEAAKALFISQPSLSSSIKELENELKINIFIRSNRGVRPSDEGAEFLGYARQVLEQTDLLEEKYLGGAPRRQRFSVSTHHYLFAANAFVELVREFGGDEYEFSYRETKTWDIIEDVRCLRSELGLIYMSRFNETVITKLLRENELSFTELFTAHPHVFLSKDHPLAKKDVLHIEELDEYPCVTFEQGEHNSFYFSEEVLSERSVRRSIKVSDRAAVVNFLIGLDGFHISTGVFPEYLHGDDICSIPLDVDERIRVGYITRRDITLSRLGEIYIEALEKIASDIDAAYNQG